MKTGWLCLVVWTGIGRDEFRFGASRDFPWRKLCLHENRPGCLTAGIRVWEIVHESAQGNSVLATASCWFVLSGCREVPTSVGVGSGPSFSLNGSGRLASLRVYGPRSGHKIPFDQKSLV